MIRGAFAALALLLSAQPALAQSVSVDWGEGGLAGTSLGLIAAITLLGLVPGLAVTVTCFPFVVTVLSILRQAIGLQQSPPNMLIVTLALFLSWFVMDPVLTAAWEGGVAPLIAGETNAEEALPAITGPFRDFMGARVDPPTLDRLSELRGTPVGPPEVAPLSVLTPAFLLSELSRAFQIGFLIFIPFLVIDLVVAAVLMAMGMMMVPPAMVALPFKLAFFTVADGWVLLSEALVRGYVPG
ncbi:flagellar biosynthetic protein FliP [Hasllibacter halocynthiae]|uniref:Flagellar biosynthetic protein FliP n=1 Tax=Hasllibacter halocynthiae TaxID=595589 RepID=A0A2T0X2S5_9RHOB|nr:flagellar type III secretion system pore protein FliP [Hasllibacter halocynthiae]PRY93195.1 flagellar biosynthetic protein FliP [Hasllibacter halocynthiae]